MADIGIFYVCHFHFTSAKLNKYAGTHFCVNFWMSAKMTDVKLFYVGDSHFMSDKADVPTSFREDCFSEFYWMKMIIFSFKFD